MLDMFSQYIYYLDLALLGILGLFVIGGLIAGVKKSLISFSLLILLVVGLYIGLNPICNLLLDVNAEWMGITSFRDAIVSEITNNVPEISSLMIEGTAVYNLVMNITVTVMRLIVFFVGSLVIVFVIEPILRVIVKVILGVRKKKGQKKLRLLGAGVNLLKGVFILTLVFFPIGGSIGLVKELRTVIEESNEQEMALMPLAEGYVTDEYQEVFDLVEAFENLRFKKIINVSKFVLGKPLDEYIFNKTLMLKHEGKKSYIVDDLKEGLKIASIYLRYSENGEFDIYQISEEDLTTIVESLKKIKTIDVILPVVVEIALNFDEVKAELEKFNINANDIINLKWAEDFDILLEIGKEVILLGEIDEDSLLELETAKVRSIINKLSSTSILQYAFPKALEYLVTLDEIKPYLGEDFTFDFDKINLTTELGILVDIYDELKVIGFKDFDFEEVLNDNDKFDAVLAIVGKVASSDLLNQALPNLADNLMKEELPESFSGIVDIEGVDLSEEINKVLNIIKGLHNLGINFDSGFEDIDLTKLNTDDVLDIIDQIFDLDLFDEKELFRALFRELKIEGADDYDFGDMDLEVEKEAIKHVVSKMVVFIKGANTTDFEDFQNIITDETNRENLLDIIASASDSKVMVEVVLKLFNSMLQDNMPEELKDIIDLSKLPTSSWRSEAEKLLDIFLDINDANLFGEGEMTITNDLAIKIMTNIFDLELIKGQEEKIFRELFKMIPVIDGFEPDYSNVDWSAEPDRILDILKAVAEIGDISDFDFDTVNTLTVEQISKLIKAVNNSTLFRPMLLTIIDGEVTDIGDWTTDWLDNQITTNVMAPISEWDNEIDILARLIVNITKFDLDSFDLETSSNADIDKLGDILSDMNKSQLFNMNNITSVLEVTDPNSILYGADFSNLPTTEAEWEVEIDILVQALKEFNAARPIAIEKHAEIGKVLNTMKQSTIIGPNLELIIENSTAQIDDNFSSYIDIKKVDLYAIDWVVELQTVYNIYTAFGSDAGESSFADIADRIANSGDEEAIADLLRNVNNSDLARQMLPKMIHEALVAADLTEWEDDWFTAQLGEDGVIASKEDWLVEIDSLASLISKTISFDISAFDLENSSNDDIDKLGSILLDMNQSRILDINNITSILEVSDTSSVLYGADFTNLPDSKEAWDDEIVTLVKALKELKLIKPLDIDKHEQIGNLLNTVQDSIILSPNLKLILENSLSEIDPKFDSYIDLSEIDDADWVVELDVLNKLYSDFGEFTGAGFNLTSLTGANIESIMKDASDGQLATQIFGKIINEQLELILKEHNPKDESDVLIYDYTDQTTLKNNAKDVGKLIDFGNVTLALFQTPEDEVQGIIVGDYIKSYKVSLEESRPTFADVYFPAILAYANDINDPSPLEGLEMTSVDYELEGQLFIDFYEAETAYDKAFVLAEIYATSTLTKAIMASLGYTI